jgi:hypothetical protein
MEVPVIKIYDAKFEEIQRFLEEAAEMGIHTGLMLSPAKLRRETETQGVGAYTPPKGNSLLLVTSHDPELVELVVDSQKYRMQETLDEPPKESLPIKPATILQLVLTGLVAGFMGGGVVTGIASLSTGL